MSCVPSWLRFRLKAEKGLLHPPRKPVITLRLTSDVWFVNLIIYIICLRLHMSVWIKVTGKVIGSSQWIFWCIYRPKIQAKMSNIVKMQATTLSPKRLCRGNDSPRDKIPRASRRNSCGLAEFTSTEMLWDKRIGLESCKRTNSL